MATKQIYLDYAAATPLDSRVTKAMQPYLRQYFFNPSSAYSAAKVVHAALDAARSRVAHWLGAKSREVIFTAGATESINLAIQGVMRANLNGKVLVSSVEHEAVLAAAAPFTHELIAVHRDGVMDVEALKRAISDDVVLVSVAISNNEIGTIQPLGDIAAVIREVRQLRKLRNNTKPLYLHTDASQAACYLDLHVSRLGVDLLTINGGKMYGPKQTGVLFIKTGVQLEPLILGGGQEFGIRSGTENVAGFVGLAAAFDIAQSERKAAIAKAAVMRDELERLLITELPQTVVNGNRKKRNPNILHVSWPGVDGERLLIQLDEAGLMASTGSACAANKHTASHVLKACGLDAKSIQGSLRLSLGRYTKQSEIQAAAAIITKLVKNFEIISS